MTKTTEELKRETYRDLENVKGLVTGGIRLAAMAAFEDSLEEYLERLRQESARKGLRFKSAICLLEEMTANRDELARSNLAGDFAYSALRQERDELRNKLQAFEFANKSAGEMLQAANEKIKRQRQSIGQLKNERDNAVHLAKVRSTQRDKLAQQLQESRKDQGAASASDSTENDPESILRSVQRNCQHSFRQQHEFPSGKLQNECIFCLKIED